MIKAVIFDMDGLMFDTERLLQKAYHEAGIELGVNNIGDVYLTTLGIKDEEANYIFAKSFGGDLQKAEQLTLMANEYLNDYYENNPTPFMPGLTELLRYLQDKNVPIGLASGSPTERVDHHIDSTNMRSIFKTIITGNMVTFSKPHPEPYLRCTNMMGFAPLECLVLEDSENGVRSAHASGAMVIMVPSFDQFRPEIQELLYAKCNDLFEVKSLIETDGLIL